MTHSVPTGSWIPDEKRNNVEFFKKLHMLRDDLHLKERENMKSAIARIESNKYRRNNKAMNKEKKDNVRYNKKMLANRSLEGSEFIGMRQWKDGHAFEVEDEMFWPWVKSHGIWSSSNSQRPKQNQLSYKMKSQSIALKDGQVMGHFTSGIRSQCDSRIPSLTDNTIARIATNMNDFDSNKTYDFMRNPDHLPSIPSVGHRVSISHKNRLKAMTWESEFSESSKTKKRESDTKANALTNKTLHEATKMGKEGPEKKKHNGLSFAVNLNDKEVFKYLNTDILPSTPSSSTVGQNINEKFPNIPTLSLPIEASRNSDNSSDSPRSDGELKNAMRKLVTAHETFEDLAKELENIAHENDELESFKEPEESSKEL